MRAAVERAEDHYDYRVARLVLYHWQSVVTQLSREKAEEEAAFEHYAGALLGRVLTRWAWVRSHIVSFDSPPGYYLTQETRV